MSLWFNYRVRKIYGIWNGYQGFLDTSTWIELNPDVVRDIHQTGGTILGSSRGEFYG